MVAQYTVKIGDKWYRAGDTIPDNDNKAVSVKAEPPVISEEKVEEAKPQKRHYKRRS